MTNPTSAPLQFIVDRSRFLRIHYLETVNLDLGIQSKHTSATLVIDSLALRFASRRGSPTTLKVQPETNVIFPGGPISVEPMKKTHCTIPIRPNLLFLKGSNYFEVAATYREAGIRIGTPESLVDQVSFAIIDPAPCFFGQVFISYKEPEDRSLADRLFEFAHDAGFKPYMAPPDIRTGTQIWGKKIPPEIKASRFLFVIWTNNSLKGPGVKREIKIARDNKIAVVPFLEKKCRDPKLFGRDVEYMQFDRRDPDEAFAKVVEARRSM